MQRKRMFAHDYTRVGFYMITMVTANRHRLFGECRDNRVLLSKAGAVVTRRWREIPNHRPEIEASTLVVMPDHLHGILFVKRQLTKPVGNTIRGFASGVTSELRKSARNPALKVWEKGFHDRVIMSKGTLRAERNYIRDNPRRYCLLKQHRDLFVRVNRLTHPRLPAAASWAGFGNLFLLDKPRLVPVQVSRRASQYEIASLQKRVLGELAGGAVMVSPFVSPGEKAIAAAVMQQKRGSLILLKTEGFPAIYKPSGAYFDLCAQGRLLVLSAFPYSSRKQPLTRERCLRMNEWAKEMCGMCANNGKSQ